MREALFGDVHPVVGASLYNMGMASVKLGRYEEATDYYQRALHMRLSLLDDDHPDVAASLNGVGVACAK